MLDKYITIQAEAQTEIIEKKSRFIASVFPIASQEEADAHLVRLRKQYWDATHNCYAYQLGEKNEIQRFSDDGEPQGTAGKPILDVLKGEDIKNTLIIVTRYFGGTLLGTGGLVRAYGKSAKEGVLEAGLVQKVRIRLFAIQMSYTLSGRVQYILNEKGYTIRESQYTDIVTFIVEVEINNQENFQKWLIDSTNAEVSIAEGEYCLITIPYIAN
ncbi:MAG: YigZ family protein [Cellulosilyticaceae bacterium]